MRAVADPPGGSCSSTPMYASPSAAAYPHVRSSYSTFAPPPSRHQESSTTSRIMSTDAAYKYAPSPSSAGRQQVAATGGPNVMCPAVAFFASAETQQLARAIALRLMANGTSVVWFLVGKNGRVAPAATTGASSAAAAAAAYHVAASMGGMGDVVEVRGGAVQVENSVDTHSSKAPGFQPSNL